MYPCHHRHPKDLEGEVACRLRIATGGDLLNHSSLGVAPLASIGQGTLYRGHRSP